VSKRAVGLEGDPVLPARVEESLPVLVRTELHLVDNRRDARHRQQLLEFSNVEVGNPDRACVTELVSALHSRPRPGRAALRPVDDVQVYALDPEPLEAALNLRDRVFPRGIELGGDEHLLARDTAFAQSLPDALLVTVRLSGVDVPIAELERPTDGLDALASVRHLPDPKPEQRDPVAVGEWASPSVCRPGAYPP